MKMLRLLPLVLLIPAICSAQNTFPASGNVGIATSGPVERFQIHASYGDPNSAFMIDATDNSDPETYNLRIFPYVLGAGKVGYQFQTKSAVGGTTLPLVFDNAGHVGIGTTNPDTYQLAVNGSIHTKEMVVDLDGWSDYVFKPGYRLASLAEVADAIKRQGHLPGVPSAQEVAEHGVNVGEMQAKLLAKIEELTLHQIEQEKRLSAQSVQLASQTRQLAAQSERLSDQSNQLSVQSEQLSAQSARIERLEVENASLRRKP